MMEDDKIIELYFSRCETAIAESDRKYGKYCRSIADRILECDEDSEECVNDTWFCAWNTIPPTKPTVLKSFFGALTRNLALNRCDYNNAKKGNPPYRQPTSFGTASRAETYRLTMTLHSLR